MGNDAIVRVLFVCTGNICRSPMAEGMLRDLITVHHPGLAWQVDSAGIYAQRGSPPDANAVSVAGSFGADIRDLRSRPVVDADFGDFKVIVALDLGHLDYLKSVAPQTCRADIGLLEDLNGVRFEVPDPYGQSLRAFRKTGELIARGLPPLVARARRDD
jgi:protein-tyrosine phosphatase